MAESDSIKLKELANELHKIAAQLSGVETVLDSVTTYGIDDTVAIGNTAHMLAGMSAYINTEIGRIADQIRVIGNQSS